MSFDNAHAYRMMCLIRFTEEEIVARYHKYEEMRCPTHLSIGQEAAAVGVIMALQADDHIYSSHRCHGHYLAKGGNLDSMTAELFGKTTGCNGGWGGSMHLCDEAVGFSGASPIVGDSVSLAVGSAMAFKMDGSSRVAVAFFGDAAVETGQFWEAVNFATLQHLPIMFVSENNTYATATHISLRQPPTPIYQRVKAFMWSQQIPDEDIEAIYRVARECRDAHPGFIEINTYRYREHVGPNYDWDLGYRTEEEVLAHMDRDPLKILRNKLSNEEATIIESEVNSRVQSAFKNAAAAPLPEGLQV